MYVTSKVDLPEEVVEAHANGTLVFFVGAGASAAAPSSLPTFENLAKALAKRASHRFSKRGGLDFFIGSLESLPGGFNAHRHAKELISDPKSRFNPMHRAIIDLANTSGKFRVVTTNYDDHLTRAAGDALVPVGNTWFGPALPLGRSFEGLVHLHGSVTRSATDMILTDRDFGRAYMTDAWAARFLLPMFDRFTVVFVGYSHDDVIMRYLALGLPSRDEDAPNMRFAFTNAPNDPKWDYLGIVPIEYPAVKGDHGALVAAFEAWGDRARMGQLDHRVRMREIVTAGPKLTPVERDYVTGRLRTTQGTQEFAQATLEVQPDMQASWLRWIEGDDTFKALFGSGAVEDASAVLGNWFCHTFITSLQLHGAALQTVQRIGQVFSDTLFRGAAWTADELAKLDADAGRRWKALIATSIGGQSSPAALEHVLPYSADGTSIDISVIRACLRPCLQLKRRWFLDDSEHPLAIPDADVVWASDEHSLTSQISKLIEGSPPGDSAVGVMLEEALTSAYDLLEAYHGKRAWDQFSSRRSSIAPHEQDSLRHPVDALIDGLRAYADLAFPVRPELPMRWWETSRSLFQRLALYVVNGSSALSDEEKISWLLDRSALYVSDLKHETYQVLAQSVGGATSETRSRLLAAVLDGPTFADDIPERHRHVQYAVFNTLVWLTQHAPNWNEALRELAKVHEENPTFLARENPDFDSWMSTGAWGGNLPMAPEDFIDALSKAPSAAVDELFERDYSERNFDEPSWDDALSLIRQIVELHPALGDTIWSLVDQKPALDTKGDDLRRAIIEGWAKSPLGHLASTAAERVASQVDVPSSSRSIGRFLVEQAQLRIDEAEDHADETMRGLARALWEKQGKSYSHFEDMDPVSLAPLYLNSWPGDLAQFWMNAVDRQWRKHRNDWEGLSEEEQSAISDLLAGPRHALDAIEPAFASQVFFMFAADPEFTRARILPLFDRHASAKLAWTAYLHHPRYNDRMLAAGMLESTLIQWERIDQLGQHGLKVNFFGMVASIVSFAAIPAKSRKQLLDSSVLVEQGKHASSFAREIVHFLAADGISGERIWRKWLGRHVRERLQGIPRTASADELSVWADIVPYLGAGIPEAVKQFAERDGIPLNEHFMEPDFPEGTLDAYGDQIVTYYVRRIRASTANNYMVAYHVNELIETLTSRLGKTVVKPLTDAAADQGFVA